MSEDNKGIACPNCGHKVSGVEETRKSPGSLRRLRRCANKECGQTFTTYEELKYERLYVLKRGDGRGRKEAFAPEKIRKGLILALAKGIRDDQEIDSLCDEIIKSLKWSPRKEIRSEEIGRAILDKLKKRSDLEQNQNGKNNVYRITYIRFASVFLFDKQPEIFLKLIDEINKTLKAK